MATPFRDLKGPSAVSGLLSGILTGFMQGRQMRQQDQEIARQRELDQLQRDQLMRSNDLRERQFQATEAHRAQGIKEREQARAEAFLEPSAEEQATTAFDRQKELLGMGQDFTRERDAAAQTAAAGKIDESRFVGNWKKSTDEIRVIDADLEFRDKPTFLEAANKLVTGQIVNAEMALLQAKSEAKVRDFANSPTAQEVMVRAGSPGATPEDAQMAQLFTTMRFSGQLPGQFGDPKVIPGSFLNDVMGGLPLHDPNQMFSFPEYIAAIQRTGPADENEMEELIQRSMLAVLGMQAQQTSASLNPVTPEGMSKVRGFFQTMDRLTGEKPEDTAPTLSPFTSRGLGLFKRAFGPKESVAKKSNNQNPFQQRGPQQ